MEWRLRNVHSKKETRIEPMAGKVVGSVAVAVVVT